LIEHDSGTIRVGGRDVDPRSPAQAIRLGIGLVAEDRRAQNIVPDLTVRENLFLAHIGKHRGFGLGYGQRRARVAELMGKLGLPADRLDANLLTFSGGMQQKVIIARWLLVEPDILILDEPTKGVDIGTRSSIYGILREIAYGGVAVVVISSDFEELLGTCERIVIISDGTSIADLPASLLTEEKLTLLAAPRTSTERNARLLREIAEDHGASAFWALLDEEGLICLAAAEAPGGPGIGLAPGRATRYADTPIAEALARRADGFVTEPGGGLSTLLVPIRNRRGHDLGWIGLSIPPGRPLPAREDIVRRVAELADAEAAAGAR
jgi:ABC-type multidrug transport system ATPase subunit